MVFYRYYYSYVFYDIYILLSFFCSLHSLPHPKRRKSWFISGFSIIFFSDTICVSLQSKQYKKDVGTSTTLKHRKKDTSTKEVFHSYPTLEKTIISIILFCVRTISLWLIMLLKLPPFHSLDVIFSLNWNHLKAIGKQIYK